MTALHFMQLHLAAIIALVIYVLVNVANMLGGHPVAERRIHKVIDVLSFLQRLGSEGWLKMPLLQVSTPAAAPAKASPPPAPPGAILVLLGALALLAGARPAHADGLSSGPTLPLVRVDLHGHSAPVELAAGAGYQVNLGFLPHVLGGHAWDMLGVELAGFGSHVDGGTVVSAAGMLCTLSGLLCGGAGYDVYASSGARSWFLVAAFGVNFGLGRPSPGPASLPASGTQVLELPPPANTVEF